jgi:hypothetical protein
MSERSCSIPLVVQLRGVPDDGDLAGMSETIARTVAGRLSEAARVIPAREGWNSSRETHTAPEVRFSGGSLDADLQRRVAAAIEAGIARAVSSVSGAVRGSAPPARSVRSEYQAAAAAAGPRLDPQETETGWYLNGIPVFKIQRPGGEAESSRLNFQPQLSITSDGSTRLQITVFRDANVTVLLQADAVSQLTRLASEIDIQDVVTVVPPEERPLALGAPASRPTLQPTAIPERSEAPPSPPTQKEFQQAVDVPLPPPPAASLYPQSGASPPLPSPGSDAGKIVGPPLQPSPDRSIDFRTSERGDLDDQPDWTDLPNRDLGGDPDTMPQSPDAPSSGERHDLPAAAPVERLFDEFTAGGAFGEEQKQADRIIVLKTKTLLTEEEFAAGVERARGPYEIVLPYKKTGPMGSAASPIYVSRLPGGRVRVHLRHDIFATDYASDRDLRLPPAIGKGVELNEMDVVGVKFLDEGVVSFFPAFLLMLLENEATRVALVKAGEAVAFGPSTGVAPEAAAAGGAEIITTERCVDAAGGTGLAWADRIARGLDLASSRIQEHRGWIIETWPDQGHALVRETEQLTAYARMYGLVQGASGLVHFRNSLQKGYQDWRVAANAFRSRLSEGDIERIEQIGKETEELLQAIDDAQIEVPPPPMITEESPANRGSKKE